MYTERIFNANVGDESVLNSGPDAIEQDIDHLLENDTKLIPKADIVNDVTTGGATKVLSAEAGKGINDRINTIVYSNVVNDLTTGGVDVALSAEQGIVLLKNQTASYMAFCANVNTESLDAAFGKNNEDRISGIGKQLAMYAWFKGDSKETYPFTNLIQCDTMQQCASNAFEEIFTNDNVLSLIGSSPYAIGMLYSTKKSTILTASYLNVICKSILKSNIFKKEIQADRATIESVLTAGTSYFTKTSNKTYVANNNYYSDLIAQNTNTIMIPTKIYLYNPRSSTLNGEMFVDYGADISYRIYASPTTGISAYSGLEHTITSAVSMRGIQMARTYHYSNPSMESFTLTYNEYVAI